MNESACWNQYMCYGLFCLLSVRYLIMWKLAYEDLTVVEVVRFGKKVSLVSSYSHLIVSAHYRHYKLYGIVTATGRTIIFAGFLHVWNNLFNFPLLILRWNKWVKICHTHFCEMISFNYFHFRWLTFHSFEKNLNISDIVKIFILWWSWIYCQ